MEKKPCPRCGRGITVKNDGQPRKHNSPGSERPCVPGDTPVTVRGGLAGRRLSDPAPTVEPVDDTTGTQCSEPRCTCGGDGGPEHELAAIGAFDDVQDGPAIGPREQLGEKGPWFGAMYEGRCSAGECRIEEGDRIRADGQGGYECEDCGDFEDLTGDKVHPYVPEDQPNPDQPLVEGWQEQASTAAKRHQALLTLAATGPDGDMASLAFEREQDAAMEFLSGPHAHSASDATALPTADEFLNPAEPEVKLNVSGQPEARRDWQKRYILVDPDLGDFRRTVKEKRPKGITRATTFNKHAQNTIALNGWSKRNVVMGASLRPDILRRAYGLTHDNGKQELDRIVDELETAAGAKVAADVGSFLHEICDQVDAGLKTWEDAPAAYQQDIKRYVEALAAAGLEPVFGLIERTTFIREYGGVAGTFDRIFYHRPSGQYIVGDLKTGKTMSYAMDETECQIFTYAHGVNQWGVYDWNTDTWEEPHTREDVNVRLEVSEKVGVIIHMPVQGPEAGEVYLRYADLECGRAYAELNHSVRSYPKSKVRPFEMPSVEPVAEPWQGIGGGVEVRHSVVDVPTPEQPRNWHAEFSTVATREEANALYKEAKASGLDGWPLRLLVDIGKEALTRLATEPEDG